MTPTATAAVRRVLHGETAASVARALGLNPSTLQWWVRRAVERGAQRTRMPDQKLSMEARLKIEHLLAEDRYSWGTIARLAGVNWHTVKAHALRREARLEQRRGLAALQGRDAAPTPKRRCECGRLTAGDPCHHCGAAWRRMA